MKVYANSGKTICIGRLGENLATEVIFDLYKIWDEFGEGTAALWVDIDNNTYCAYSSSITNEYEAKNFTWTISNSDTSVEGIGGCQIFYSWGSEPNTGLAKSPIYPIIVTNSIDSTSSEIPPAYSTWLNTIDAKLALAADIVRCEEAIMGMTTTTTTVAPSTPASVVPSQEEDHINLAFAIPKGDPFEIKQTYGNIEQVYNAWDLWEYNNIVVIQSDLGIDDGNLYTKVTMESFVYPPSEYTVVTRNSSESIRDAITRVVPNPALSQYVVVDDI